GFRKPRLPAGMGTVAVGAISGRSRMLYFSGFDQFAFIVMAGHAKRLDIRLRQHHLSILRRSVTDLALLVGKGRMHEFCHELGSIGLVRIVATHAIGRSKRLILMCFLQVGALYVMAIHTQGRWRFGQMKIKLDLAYLTGLMRDVAGVASHIEGRMAAAFVGHVHPGLVAAKAKVFL